MIFQSDEVAAARQTVYSVMAPTPQYAWPLLRQRLGMKVWVKHENHTPAGAFKVRGGLTYFSALAGAAGGARGVIAATRGNHGQSVGFAARKYGMAATIVVPHGNSVEKNAAMRALGVTLIEHGDDFQAAREHANELARQRAPAHGALLPPRPGQGRDDLLAGVLRKLCARRRSPTWSSCRSAWARASAPRPPRAPTPAPGRH